MHTNRHYFYITLTILVLCVAVQACGEVLKSRAESSKECKKSKESLKNLNYFFNDISSMESRVNRYDISCASNYCTPTHIISKNWTLMLLNGLEEPMT